MNLVGLWKVNFSNLSSSKPLDKTKIYLNTDKINYVDFSNSYAQIYLENGDRIVIVEKEFEDVLAKHITKEK